jgi:hypothetical protein
MKRFGFLLVLLALSSMELSAQSGLWRTHDAYLRQQPPSDMPKIFAPGLLADPHMFLMGRVAFSRDGREFYFAQNDSWERGEHASMKMVRFAHHRWAAPVTVSEGFLSPTLSLDGNTLFMRRVVAKSSMNNVWQASRTADGWSVPKPFMEEKFGVYDYMPTASGNAYVGSDAGSEDLKDGVTYAYSLLAKSGDGVAVKSLGRPLNEPGFNGDLYIAPDESYMIVSAKETKTYESELYISFRKPDLGWTAPVSLGPKINDGLAHRWGQYVSPDGKFLFYTRGTSESDCTVYWVRFDALLARLRPKYAKE